MSNFNITTAKNVFYNVILECFDIIVTFRQAKNKQCGFQSEPEVFHCFELKYKLLKRDKKPLSLANNEKASLKTNVEASTRYK